MRACANLGHQAESNTSRRNITAQPSLAEHRSFHQLDLEERVNVDGIDTSAYRLIDLLIGFAGTVENNLVGAKANLQGFEKFAAAVYLDVDTGLEHGL